MPRVIVARPDVTTEEVGEALRQGLGPRYTVLPVPPRGTAAWNPSQPRSCRAYPVVDHRRGISRRSEETVLHVIAGGYGLVVRPLNRFWIAERVRRVLQTAPGLRSGATGSGV